MCLDARPSALNLMAMRFLSSVVFASVLAGVVVASTATVGCKSDSGGSAGGSTSSTSSSGDPSSSSGDTSNSTSSGATSSGATSSGTPATSPVNLTTESVSVGGTKRTYLLAVPKNYDASKSYPLVLVFHGNGGNGSGMHQYYPLETASGDGAILAYLDAVGDGWDLFETPDQNADYDFVKAVASALRAKYNIPANRVFGDGWSNGGFFVNQVACRIGFFRAITSQSGGAPFDDPNGTTRCSPVGPIPILVLHGLNDNTVGPDSGSDTAQFWAKENGCGTSTSPTTPTPCVSYQGCKANEPVTYCGIDGLGHAIWSEGAKTSWAFFQTFP